MAFVQECLWVAQAVRLGSDPGPEPAEELESHFHLTHDDLGFVLRIGTHELRVNTCQGTCARVSIRAAGAIGEERVVTDEELTAEGARRVVLGFAGCAFDAGASGLEWVRECDPAAPNR